VDTQVSLTPYMYHACGCPRLQSPSLLGCHLLRVIDPTEFLRVTTQWILDEVPYLSCSYLLNSTPTTVAFKGATPSQTVVNLLRALGLKRRGGKHARHPKPAIFTSEQWRGEVLWDKTYFAVGRSRASPLPRTSPFNNVRRRNKRS
jgi:hypothetical protein